MAVIQYSALLTQLRGKLGGSQFNKSHAGYSLQRKATQPSRDTRSQSEQRQRMQLVQRSWKEESQVRQAQASQAAISNPVSDRFGQQVVLSGYQQYVKMMLWRLVSNNEISDPIITTPVAAAEMSLTGVSLSVGFNESTGEYLFNMSANRVLSGTPTGSTSLTRGMRYITKVDQNGNPLRPERRVFLGFLAYNSNPVSSMIAKSVTGLSYFPGDWVKLDVVTVNQGAGAITGFNSQIIQLT